MWIFDKVIKYLCDVNLIKKSSAINSRIRFFDRKYNFNCKGLERKDDNRRCWWYSLTTDWMSTSYQTSNMDEHEKNLMTGTLEQRKEAFKEDEELMRETTKFISEVIETATTEASKRKAQSEVMCQNSRVIFK